MNVPPAVRPRKESGNSDLPPALERFRSELTLAAETFKRAGQSETTGNSAEAKELRKQAESIFDQIEAQL